MKSVGGWQFALNRSDRAAPVARSSHGGGPKNAAFEDPPTPSRYLGEGGYQPDRSWARMVSVTMDYRSRIAIEPGKPCIHGLRITVYNVLDYLESGMTENEILSDFPDLEREDIRACLAFEADREPKLISATGS